MKQLSGSAARRLSSLRHSEFISESIHANKFLTGQTDTDRFQIKPGMTGVKYAFTLAEVLITLGIIGVVAAMTIPALITHYQKESVATQLKKTYSTISQAVRMSESENGEVAGWDMSNKQKADVFDTYFAPYLKVSKNAIKAQELDYYSPGGQRETGLAIIRGGAYSYTLLSGVQIIVNNGVVTGVGPNQGAGTAIGLLIDLNGYNTKPNRFGRDAFYLLVTTEKGTILDYSDDGELGTVQRTREQLLNGPSRCNYQCNKRGRGKWCGALIQKDGWKISKDYPW